MEYKKFDAHTHIYPEAIAEKACINLGKFYSFTVHGAGTYPALCGELKENGFDGMFLLCVATNAHQVQKVNDTIVEAVAHAREQGLDAYGFMGMHQDYENMAAEVERCHAMGLTGAKLHPDIQACDIDDKRFYPLYEALQRYNMPIFLHMGDKRPEYRYSMASKLKKVLDDFPALKAVAAHFGSYSEWDNAKCLYGHPNVWYDLSSALWALTPEQALTLIKRCGYDRVMFGTDYPVYHVRDYEELFDKLDLNEEQKQDIYYNNAMRFLSECRNSTND